MDRIGITLKLLLISLFLKCKFCEGIGEDCDVTFDLDTPSVMLVAGSNASVMCEASCSHDYEDAQVIWTDDRGRQILPYPNRVFAVPYSRGLRNNLLIIGADTESEGAYLCSLLVASQLVRRRAFDLVVFGVHSKSVDYHFPRRTGPRRGDVLPEEETDVYRPVRSVRLSRHSKHSQYSRHSRHSRHTRYSRHSRLQRLSRRSPFGWGNHVEGDTPTTSRPSPVETDKSRMHDPSPGGPRHNRRASDTTRFSIAPHHLPSRTQGLADTSSYPPSTDRTGRLLNAQRTTHQTYSSTDLFKVTRMSTFAIAPTNRDFQARTAMYPGDSLASTTTDFQASTTPNYFASTTTDFQASTTPNYFASTTTDFQASTTPNHFASPSTYSQASTTPNYFASTSIDSRAPASTNSLTSSPSSAPFSSTGPSVKSSSQPYPIGKPGSPDAQGGQPDCPEDKDEGDSTFGKYGVLVCSISLAVAFLLFYAILMLIFLPKIMARRTMVVQHKEKSSWGGSTYKKRNSYVLCDMGLASSDSGSPSVREKDIDNKLDKTSHPEKTTIIEENELQSTDNGNVSTFLLRQTSEMKKREEDTKEADTAPKEEMCPAPSRDASTAVQGSPSGSPEQKAENTSTVSKEEIGNSLSHEVSNTVQEGLSEITKEKKEDTPK